MSRAADDTRDALMPPLMTMPPIDDAAADAIALIC